VVGFCYGGGIANFMATRLPDLDVAVPFYGGQPSNEDVAKIRAPLLLHYAEKDDRITGGWPKYETALKAAGVNYQAFIYPGVQHGSTTTPRRATMKQLQSWRGNAQSASLILICAGNAEILIRANSRPNYNRSAFCP
jgi:carboxymethylenebutenolidase